MSELHCNCNTKYPGEEGNMAWANSQMSKKTVKKRLFSLWKVSKNKALLQLSEIYFNAHVLC